MDNKDKDFYGEWYRDNLFIRLIITIPCSVMISLCGLSTLAVKLL